MTDISDIIAIFAADLRKRVADKGRDGSKTVNEVKVIKGITFTGGMAPRRQVQSGPAVRIAMGNAYRLHGANWLGQRGQGPALQVLLYVEDGRLVVTLIHRDGRSWFGGHAPLDTVELADPDMFSRLATALAKIGITYTPTKE